MIRTRPGRLHEVFAMNTVSRFFRLLSAALCTALLAGCALPGGASSLQSGLTRYSIVWYDVFDTVTTVIAYCETQEEFDAQMEALHADLKEYNDLYDIYNACEGLNNLYTVNRNAGIAPVQVDDRIIAMLQEAVELYHTTNGKMNIAMGSVLRIWHDAREAAESSGDPQLPDPAALEAAALHMNIEDLVIDAEAGTVYLTDPEMSLDVGSCGKGYACEMAARAAQARGLASASISVGGNTRGIGTKPGGEPWLIGIESPWDPSLVYGAESSYLDYMLITDQSIVTSGDYQRYFTVDGVRYHHLIDPDTLQPAAYYNGVSVLCGDSGLADCLSTGLFCMPLEQGQALVEGLDGVEALWCLPDGTTVESSGWAAFRRQG